MNTVPWLPSWRVALCGLALAAAGCGSSENPTAAAPPTDVAVAGPVPTSAMPTIADAAATELSVVSRPAEWIATGLDTAIYLAWTESGSTLVGAMQYARMADDGLTVASTSIRFEGTIAGPTFTLDIGGATWNGVIDGDTITITLPDDSGALTQLVLVPGTINDFNLGLERLRANAAANVEVATEASIDQAESQRASQLYTDLRGATTTLESLLNDASLFNAVDEALQVVYIDADAARSIAGDCFETPFAVETVRFDVESVNFAADGIDGVAADIVRLVDKIRSLAIEFEPYAGPEDGGFALYAAEDAAASADAYVAEIKGRADQARAEAQGVLAGIEHLDDSC